MLLLKHPSTVITVNSFNLKEIRRPIAYSFHEVAKILGPEMAQQ
jgi:hypothetical protein